MLIFFTYPRRVLSRPPHSHRHNTRRARTGCKPAGFPHAAGCAASAAACRRTYRALVRSASVQAGPTRAAVAAVRPAPENRSILKKRRLALALQTPPTISKRFIPTQTNGPASALLRPLPVRFCFPYVRQYAETAAFARRLRRHTPPPLVAPAHPPSRHVYAKSRVHSSSPLPLALPFSSRHLSAECG